MASTVWRGYISFGLISIPIRLFRAARAERISFRKLYKEGPAEAAPTLKRRMNVEEPIEPVLEPVHQVAIRAGVVQQGAQPSAASEVLPASAVVKGYEYEKGHFVEVDAEELKSAQAKTSSSMEIDEFVRLAEIDPVYFETSYYVTPEEAGEKAYALLYRSMQQTGLVALAQFAMHSREHTVVLRPGRSGLLAHTMFFASEVRSAEEFRANVQEVTKKELELAQTLIRSLEQPFEPEKYRDTYRERIQTLIDSKMAGKTGPVVSETRPRQAEVVDIAEALRESLRNLKKPAAGARSKGGVVKKSAGRSV